MTKKKHIRLVGLEKISLSLGPHYTQYLIGDSSSIVLYSEFGQRHLWFRVQGVVAMVIVAFLKEGVVSCLVTGQLC